MASRIFSIAILLGTIVFSCHTLAGQTSKEKAKQALETALAEYNAEFNQHSDRNTYIKWGNTFSQCAGVYSATSKHMKLHDPESSRKYQKLTNGARKAAIWHFAHADNMSHVYTHYSSNVDLIQKQSADETFKTLLANNIPMFRKSLAQCIRLVLIQNSAVRKVNSDTKNNRNYK